MLAWKGKKKFGNFGKVPRIKEGKKEFGNFGRLDGIQESFHVKKFTIGQKVSMHDFVNKIATIFWIAELEFSSVSRKMKLVVVTIIFWWHVGYVLNKSFTYR